MDDLQTALDEEQKNPFDFEAVDQALPAGDSANGTEPMVINS